MSARTLLIIILKLWSVASVSANERVCKTYESSEVTTTKDLAIATSDQTPLNGLLITRYPDGAIRRNVPYTNGKVSGEITIFNHAGKCTGIENWRDGKQDGLSEYFYEDGQIERRLLYREGLEHGMYQAWHPNGDIYIVGSMESGMKVGAWRVYDTSGEISELIVFNNGVIKSEIVSYFDIERTWRAGRKEIQSRIEGGAH